MNGWVKKCKHLFREEQGSIIVITAMSLVFLMGVSALVVDVGYLYTQKRHLQNAADSAALAGAREYLVGSSANIPSVVSTYVQAHGLDSSVVKKVETVGSKVKVELSGNYSLFFARAIGFSNTDVSANATAGSLREGDIMPFTIHETQLINPGEEMNIMYQDWKDGPIGPGNFGALALGGTGANVLKDNIMYGYDGDITPSFFGEITLETWESTEPGKNVGPVKEGIQYRLDNNKTKVFIPVFDETLDKGGRTEIRVIGFAPVELKGINDEGELIGIFSDFISDDSKLKRVALLE